MYSTQPYHEPSFLKEVWGIYGVGVFVILLRMVVRIRTVGFKGWQGDDYMAVAVLVCYTVDAVTVTLCYDLGTNVDFTPAQLAAMSVHDQKKVVLGSRMQLLAWYTYTGLVWGLKAIMLFFFNRLTFGLKQKRFVKLLGITCFVTYVAVFLTITLGCYPTQRNWQVDPYPGLTCTFKPQNFYVSTVLNVLTDAAILSIPLPLMCGLQVPLKKKIALILLLSSGVFVITAAIIRIVMTLVAHPSGLTINRWGVRETIAAIVAVNIPIIKPVFSRVFWTRHFPPQPSAGNKGSSNDKSDPRSSIFVRENSKRKPGLISAIRGKVEVFEMTDDDAYRANADNINAAEKNYSQRSQPTRSRATPMTTRNRTRIVRARTWSCSGIRACLASRARQAALRCRSRIWRSVRNRRREGWRSGLISSTIARGRRIRKLARLRKAGKITGFTPVGGERGRVWVIEQR